MSEPPISIQAFICPVCHDDHSTGPHRFTDEELKHHDAEVREAVAKEIEAGAKVYVPTSHFVKGMKYAAAIARGAK